MRKGKFITLEGGEGAGKTTNLAFIVNYLKGKKKDVVVTREPGGSELGEKIRSLLLESDEDSINRESEILLMFAARAQHIREKIMPSLTAGHWVICDRFIDASYAYQGGGRQLDSEKIDALVENFAERLEPDLTFLLDLPPELGLSRVARRSVPDRFESEPLKFFYRVRDAYLIRAHSYPDRIKIIDAKQPVHFVQAEIKQYLNDLIGL